MDKRHLYAMIERQQKLLEHLRENMYTENNRILHGDTLDE